MQLSCYSCCCCLLFLFLFSSVPDYVRSVQVVSQSDTSSIVQWMPPMYPNGVITKYRLIFTSSNSSVPDDITVDGNVRSYSITNLGMLAYNQLDMYTLIPHVYLFNLTTQSYRCSYCNMLKIIVIGYICKL